MYVILRDGYAKKNGRYGLYVGQTSKTPEERFSEHLAGIRSGRGLKKNGIQSMVFPSNIDEDPVKESLLNEGATPEIISKNLAEVKANKVSQKLFDQDRFLLSEQREYSKNLVWNGRGKMEYTLSPWIDLCLMSLCNGGIVPNTTFGWWGAWLQKSKNKKIVYQLSLIHI